MSQFVGAARTKLGKDRFAAEWAQGKAMSPEEAVEYAVGRRAMKPSPRVTASVR